MTYGVVDLFCGWGITCGLESAGLNVIAGYDLVFTEYGVEEFEHL